MNCRHHHHHHHHRLHHQAWPHPVDGPPHHHLRAWPHLHLLLADGKESLPDGANIWHNNDDDDRSDVIDIFLTRVVPG